VHLQFIQLLPFNLNTKRRLELQKIPVGSGKGSGGRKAGIIREG
jgi:hypothetical protein